MTYYLLHITIIRITGVIVNGDKVKFIYSQKATNICEISTADLFYSVTVKSTVEILQNFEAFSEYMNFKINDHPKIVLEVASYVITGET